MRWPWVSRETHEAEMRILAHALDAAHKCHQDALSRYDTLLQSYHALKLAGASLPEPKPEPAPPKAPDIVTQAIIAKAGNNRALRKHFAEFVHEQRAAGETEEAIAEAIRTGVDDNEGVPG